MNKGGGLKGVQAEGCTMDSGPPHPPSPARGAGHGHNRGFEAYPRDGILLTWEGGKDALKSKNFKFESLPLPAM